MLGHLLWLPRTVGRRLAVAVLGKYVVAAAEELLAAHARQR